MKVIILQKIKGLGDVGDMKEVSEGYARNFLFPNNLAVLVSQKKILEVKAQKQKISKDSALDLQEIQKIADRLETYHLTIREKANPAGFLYAQVTNQKISTALKKNNFLVDKKQVVISEPIKQVGDYEVKIKLPHGLEVILSVSVVV
jgi:large subunit ribosomal protein L9